MSIADHISTLFKRDIQAAIEDVLLIESGTAAQLTDAVFQRIQTVWGGEKIYIQAPSNNTRNAEIRAEFNGMNHADICKKFKISLRTLYRITK